MNRIKIYTVFLKRFIKIEKPLKVIFDCSSGAVGLILKELFRGTDPPINYKLINFAPDGSFPAHAPNPLEPGAARGFQQEVLRKKADLGVIFDADGDRAVFIDNRGRIMPSYVIAYLLFLATQPPFILDTFNFKIFEKINFAGGRKIFKSRVGHKFIKEAMRAKKANAGVEYSGHYYFKKFFYADSGILAAIKTMNAVSRLPYSLADFYDLLPKKVYLKQFNVHVSPPATPRKKLKKYSLYGKIKEFDGLNFDFGGSWFNVRASNTEPLIRFTFAAFNKSILDKTIKRIRRVLLPLR